MDGPGNAAPVIIKRKQVKAGSEHHGGAWKIAYADFVTAMMAFFMLMWLLNATTEKQRKGIADYFSPNTPISRAADGGADLFGGSSVFTEEVLAQMGTGASSHALTEAAQALGSNGDKDNAESAALAEVQERLQDLGKGDAEVERLLRHVAIRLSDEGLIVELFDLPDSPLFADGTAVPQPVLAELVAVIVPVFGRVINQVAVQGHVRSYPVTLIDNPVWELSAARAQALRTLFEGAGFDPARIQRVSGYADRVPILVDPMQSRNNRLEVILLRRR